MSKQKSCESEVLYLHDRQAASEISVQELKTNLKNVKSQLVNVFAEKLELCTKLNSIEAESEKVVEKFIVVLGALKLLKELVQSKVS